MNQKDLKKINSALKSVKSDMLASLLRIIIRIEKYNNERDKNELKRQFIDFAHLLSIGEITNE